MQFGVKIQILSFSLKIVEQICFEIFPYLFYTSEQLTINIYFFRKLFCQFLKSLKKSQKCIRYYSKNKDISAVSVINVRCVTRATFKIVPMETKVMVIPHQNS